MKRPAIAQMGYQNINTSPEATKSLLFDNRSTSTQYLTRTPSLGDRRTWTFSCWFKRGLLGSDYSFIYGEGDGVSANGAETAIEFISTDQLEIYLDGSHDYKTTRVFRDSDWYHLVVTLDTTIPDGHPDAANRLKAWVNNEQIDSWSDRLDIAENSEWYINDNKQHSIGRYTGASNSLDAYVADMHLIDGIALDANSFGEYDDNGNWVMKKYIGGYGDNGFRLDFSDSSDFGKDVSGKDNHWNSTGFTAAYQTADMPFKKYASINMVDGYPTLGKGALAHLSGSGVDARANFAPLSSGKWYWEINNIGTGSGGYPIVGIADANASNKNNIWGHSTSTGYQISLQASWHANWGSWTTTGHPTFSFSDTVNFALDADAKKLWIGKNGIWFNSASLSDIANGLNFTNDYSSNADEVLPSGTVSGTSSYHFNFGQFSADGSMTYDADADGYFKYTPPSGFKALNTNNLSDTSIIRGSDYFDVDAYEGAAAPHNRTGLPDLAAGSLVWIKPRDNAYSHNLFDTVRTPNQILNSNSNGSEYTITDALTSFNSDGFTLGADAQIPGGVNNVGDDYVAWCWKVGQIPGFDIVTYTGNNSGGSNQSIGHNLVAVPNLIMIKNRSDGTKSWAVGSDDIGWGNVIELNNSNGVVGSSTTWNGAPSSTVFHVGSADATNGNGQNFVAYLWRSVEGFSKIGTYNGNSSDDGPFAYTGFKPRFIMIKGFVSTVHWHMIDTARYPINPTGDSGGLAAISANNSQTPGGEGTYGIDVYSNGFKIRSSAGQTNNNGSDYMYMAFAETPFKYANAR
jgi:hypothetical protein